MKGNRRRRGVSVGTIVMLALTVLVVAGMAAVLGTLRNGNANPDLSRIPESLSLSAEWILSADDSAETASADAAAAQSGQTAAKASQTEQPGAGMLQVVTQAPSVTATAALTFGGTVAVTATIRRSCYYTGSKKYDFDELLDLMGGSLNSDLTVVTLENLIDADQSNSDLVTPAEVLSGLKNSGVDAVNLGFVKCLDKGTKTLSATVQAAQAAGLGTVGAYASEQDASASGRIMTIGGIRIALLAYTDNLSSSSLKKLTSSGTAWLVPVTDTAAADIAAARAAGAEAVIVCMHWGKSGTATVSKAQIALAKQLAEAGADVIIGTGSRAVMPAVWLDRTDGGRTLCCYGLGTLLSEKRTDNTIAGMLLHLTFVKDAAGQVTLSGTGYSPTYVWHYTQDGVNHYRTVISDAEAPEGMQSAQVKVMKKALTNTKTRLGADSPLTPVR